MKNEDLYVYKKSDFYEDYISSQKEYYEREQVDKLLAEKDREIAELKKKLMPCLNGDCILTCEVVEKYGKENAELKASINNVLIQNRELCQALQVMYSAEEYMELQDENTQLKKENLNIKTKNIELQSFYDLHGNVDNYIDKLKAENSELKAKLESVQASAYAESVDAGMRERRLKRALWLARAERASDRARIFYFNDLKTMLDIDGFSYDSKKKKGHKKLTARIWRIIWLKVERKCRKKSKEYL